MTAERAISPGELIGDRYRIEREIGRGGMARVYEATDVRHQRMVAVKVMSPDVSVALGAERFTREIEIAARLSHPNILPLHDSGVIDGVLPYYVMPLVSGESLRHRLDRESQLTLLDAVNIAAEVADALAHAHSHGVVHRDIKPENILLEEGHARVADFGLATALSLAGGERITQSGMTLGTPLYMSPEQAAAERSVDPRTDIYSLGCVLYEMLAGETPFPGGNAQSILARKATQPAPPVNVIRESVSSELAEVVHRALARSPADRFTSASDMATALREIDVNTSMVHAHKRSRRKLLTAVMTAIAIVAVGAVGYTLSKDRRSVQKDGASSDVIAVFPFAVAGETDTWGLRSGLVFLLDQALNGSGTLRSVNAHALLAAVPRGSPDVSPATAHDIARSFGAGRFILGSIVDAGSRVQISAQVFTSIDRPDATAQVEGPKENLLELSNKLAAELLSAELAAKGSLRTTPAGTNIEAIKLYLAGLEASAAGNWRTSVDRFREAVVRDSMLAPAWFQLGADAYAGVVDDSLAHFALLRAVSLRDQLSLRDQQVLSIQLARDSGAIYRSHELARQFTERWPNDYEGWQHIADITGSTHPFLGVSVSEAERAYARAGALHRAQSNWDIDRLAMALVRRDRIAFDSLWARMSLTPLTHDFTWSVLAAKPFLYGDSAGMEKSISESRDHEPGFVFPAIINVATVDPDGAVLMARALAARAIPVEERGNAYVTAAYVLAGTGRWHAADSALTSAEQLNASDATFHRAYLMLMPDRAPTTKQLDRLAVELNAPTSDSFQGGMESQARPDAIVRPQLRLYLLGLIAARKGDDASAKGLASKLESASVPYEAGTLQRDLARGIRAEILRLHGDYAGVLSVLRWNDIKVRFPTQFQSAFYSRARERHLYAAMLDATNHPDAARWLDAQIVNQFLHDYPGRPSLLMRQARLFERAKRFSDARASYQRLSEMLVHCDDEAAPLRREAETGLRRLAAYR